MTIYDLLDAWYRHYDKAGERKQYRLAAAAHAQYRGSTMPRTFEITNNAAIDGNRPKRLAIAEVDEALQITKLTPDADATIGEWRDLELVYKAAQV